jgi:hypothetical protein
MDSPILWLLPFAYVWISSATNSSPYENTYMNNNRRAYSKSPFAGRDTPSTSSHTNERIPPTGKLLGLISFLMLALTIFSIFEHFRSATSTLRSVPYSLPSSVSRNITTLGSDLPESCGDFLTKTDLVSSGLFNQSADQHLSAGLQLFAFLMALSVVVTQFIRRRSHHQDSENRCLKDCAFVVSVALIGCMLASAMYVGLSVGKKHREVEVRYTTDVTKTGGCTWAWVAMDKRWGYWDVKEGLGWRLGLAMLGV